MNVSACNNDTLIDDVMKNSTLSDSAITHANSNNSGNGSTSLLDAATRRPANDFQLAYFVMGALFAVSASLMTAAWSAGERFRVRAPLLFVQSDATSRTVAPQAENDDEVNDNNNMQQRRRVCTILSLMSLFHFFHMGMEVSYKSLLLVFGVATLGYSRRSAAWLVGVCYLAYTVGRGEKLSEKRVCTSLLHDTYPHHEYSCCYKYSCTVFRCRNTGVKSRAPRSHACGQPGADAGLIGSGTAVRARV